MRTRSAAANDLEGYERLILDAMLGDQSLFTRSDGIERLWEISTPLLDHPPAVEPYQPGLLGTGVGAAYPRAAPLASARAGLTGYPPLTLISGPMPGNPLMPGKSRS